MYTVCGIESFLITPPSVAFQEGVTEFESPV